MIDPIPSPPIEPSSSRGLDPNVAQRQASDPLGSVWVSASAGTGKTKVLVDRLLRLFLPRADGQSRTAPQRILCLTFTKAAANEMALRIGRVLSRWAVMPDDALVQELRALSGEPPTAEMVKAARRLFAQVVDTPGGLNIMTIHAFCQSVLGRFPLEAGLSPHFTVIDETTAYELLKQARDRVLRTLDYQDSVITLARLLNEKQFMSLLHVMSGETLPEGDIYAGLCRTLGVDAKETPEALLTAACQDDVFDRDGLYRACRALDSGAKGDQDRGVGIQRWLEATPDVRIKTLETYRQKFITLKNELRKKMATAGAIKSDPTCVDVLTAEGLRLLALEEKCKALKTASLTHDLLTLGRAILNEYQVLKEDRGALDYNDLVLKTRTLFRQEGIAPWVLFKLDGGVDHILIDEAQDTNPEQWDIVATLCEDFFSGAGAREDLIRTVFAVGDEKQSIYSFQRAAPDEFARMKEHFAERTEAARQGFKNVQMDISFRTTASVLRLVDRVFAEGMPARAGLGAEIPSHHSFRIGQAGHVELWPLFQAQEEESCDNVDDWPLPTTIIDTSTSAAELADHIGSTIKGWLDRGERLESQDRVMAPGDIMILVRSRTAFVGQLVRALKTRNIPVSGVDRMVLGAQLAVMDLLALAQFALLPDDDLTLACVLKSPLVDWDEDQLYDVAIDRGKTSLWTRVCEQAPPDTVSWLKQLIRISGQAHPYEFFSSLLQSPCPADPHSGLQAIIARLGEEARDPLDEFLNTALAFEQDHIPALQNFLIWQQREDITVKRELEEAGSAVRIMTVHGAKGLQAPIVILPDTTRTAAGKKTPRLLWPDKSGLDVPLWCPTVNDEPALYKDARQNVEDKLDEEYRRLLYVAMTRAEDRLYIGGYSAAKTPIDDSWYSYVRAAFECVEDVEEVPFDDERVALKLSNPQTREPDKPSQSRDVLDCAPLSDTSWLSTAAPAEPYPPRPLTPSRPSQTEPAAQSPLVRDDLYRFRRGNITHKLLQILPELPREHWQKAARDFTAQPSHALPETVQEGIVRETLAILEHPDLTVLFGPGSQAEVPVTGYVNGQLVSGQIDRLFVTEEAVWIIDYKTNRPPPDDERSVPAMYCAQMKSYCDIVANIFPDRPIRSFLLWTDGARLMELKNL